jgi:hypothetical protein
MSWILHDSYINKAEAQSDADTIVKIGLSKGVKIQENKKNAKRPFELYIRASEKKNVE